MAQATNFLREVVRFKESKEYPRMLKLRKATDNCWPGFDMAKSWEGPPQQQKTVPRE